MLLRLQERRPPAVLARGVPPLLVAVVVTAAMAVYWYERIAPRQALLLTIGVAALYALTLLALVDLERLVLVVVFCSMVFPQSLVSPGGAHVALCDLLLVFALAAWLAWFAVRRRPIVWLRGNPYLLPALVFAFVTLVSVLWSRNWVFTVKQAIQIFEIVVVVPVLFSSVPRSLDGIRRALVAYAVFAAGLSLVVFFYFMRRVVAGDVSAEYLPGMHKNATGSFLGMACVIVYGLWLEGRSGTRWVIWLLPIELAGLFGTISRGAMIGTVVALLALTLLMVRRRVLTVVLLVAATVIFLTTIQSNLATTGYSSASVRPLAYAGGVRWIEAHPILGTGAGTYFDSLPTVHIGLTDPDNLFLLTWAEIGIFGVGALFFLLFRITRLAAVLRVAPQPAASLGITVAVAALASFVHFQFDSTWTRGTATMTFALIGLLPAILRLAPTVEQTRAPATPQGRSGGAPGPTQVARGRSMRVLHVVVSPDFTAVERHIVRLSRGLRKRGIDCRIACPLSARGLRLAAEHAAVPVAPAADRGSSWLAQVLRSVETMPPDVIHVHDQAGSATGWRVAEAAGALFVRTQHSVRRAPERLISRLSTIFRRSAEPRVDAVIAVSEAVAYSLAGLYPATAPVAVITTGVDLPSDAQVERLRRQTDQLPRPAAVFFGDLVSERGMSLLLLALVRVRTRLRKFHLVIAGTGPAEGALREQAHELGVAKAVEWLGDVQEASGAFRRAQFAVNPSPVEGIDVFTAEAMAWSLPVVAPRAGESTMRIQDGLTGLLFRPGDVRDLADAMIALASNPRRAETLGWAARHVALERFGIEATIALTAETYESTLQRASKHQRPAG